MEMNFKDFTDKVRTANGREVNNRVLISYENFFDIIRKDLAELRKEELDRAMTMNTLKKDKLIIKNKEYLKEQKIATEKDLRDIIQKKQYHVREYVNDIDSLVRNLVNEFVGYSVLTQAFEDPDVSDIFCLKYNKIYVERKGVNEKYPYTFKSEKHYNDFIERLVKEAGKELNKGDSKILDFDLYEDRYCAIEDIVSPNGKSLTIRKHGTSHITLEQIIEKNCMNQEVANFLGTIINGENNIIYAGLTGSGK